MFSDIFPQNDELLLFLVHHGEPAMGVAILIASRHQPPSTCPASDPRHRYPLFPDSWLL